MKKLLCYLKDYKKESVLGPLFKLLEATLELFVPLVVAAIIDTGIGNQDRGYVVKMCLVLVLLGIIGLAFSITAQYFAAKAAVGFVTKIRHVLFAHIQKLSYAELDTQGTSTLITRMTSDMNQVQNGMNLTLRLLLRSPFVVIGAMVMAFTIDVKAALVFAVGIPALAVVVFGVMLACIPLYRKVQNRLDKVLGLTRENLTGVRVLRAFCKEEEQEAEFQKQNQTLTDTQKFVGRISALLNPLTYVIINVAIIALIWIGAIRVDMGIITQGAVVALYNYMSQILTELIKLANLIINITKSVACGNRIQSVLEVEPSIKDGTKDDAESASAVKNGDEEKAEKENESEYSVVFDHAGICYPDAAQEAVSDISLKVRPGETIGIIGGTGSGKSSLVNLIPRFYDCSSGAVYVDGKNVCAYGLTELRDKIGVVPQKAVLFAGTIRSNMQWGKPDATEEEIFAALEIAQAKDVVLKKEKGLDTEVEQGGKNFSGGQRQRLTIARALVKQPEILILDDSSSALDFATDAALRMAIGSMEHKPTLFIVSQRTSSIQYADKIVVLDDGAVVGIGTHEELMDTCEVYREIYDSQYKRGENE
ncbi:ABC transporter ATP-binding protein [uncultured Eubacterium sp.]|uniref:ABC transporter ATP-binding protein n=1 Tax=uncultured Eubacterium sp. TaxID=165185 RepID=UPI0025D779CA|nr:ABC transporter ATP-binding protein [uncultured Eubacterium sp.]MCI6536304.1 ABC transporter ATP-binding protein/permease [Lachnospiraceae bacterium]